MPEEIGKGEGFTRTKQSVIAVAGAAATYFENIDLEIPSGYIALIHDIHWLRDGHFNAGVVDYEIMGFLFATQTKEGALSATLEEFERSDLLDFFNHGFAFQAADYGDSVTTDFSHHYDKPLLVQKGKLRHYVATGGTVPANNYLGVRILYELARVTPTNLATLLSGARD